MWKQHGRVVWASDLKSGVRGFKSRSAFGRPQFKSLGHACKQPTGLSPEYPSFDLIGPEKAHLGSGELRYLFSLLFNKGGLFIH